MKHSAGILLFRRGSEGVEVLLAHPGGPFWKRRDLGAWSIPKGEYDRGTESASDAARRELREETGIVAEGELLELGSFAQPSGKLVSAFALERDFDPAELQSNLCRIEWPPRSGRFAEIPEVDRVQWFGIDEALTKIVKGQAALLRALIEKIGAREA
jgi:predicted NUDIX family NTP pyrophosphohydrolase